MRFVCHLLVVSLSASLAALCVASMPEAVNDADLQRMKTLVALTSPDVSAHPLATIYHSLSAQTLLKEKIAFSAEICAHLKSQSATEELSVESVYYLTSSSKLLSNCQISSAKHVPKLESTLAAADASVADIYRAAIALQNAGKAWDSAKVGTSLLAALKRDESLLNCGLAFQLAAKLSDSAHRSPFVDKIGDVMVMADEVDNKYVQFEGGLGVTSAVIQGVYRLAQSQPNKPFPVTHDTARKMANYLLSRKHVLSPKSISELLSVLSLFADNKHHIPVVVTHFGSTALSAANPVLTVRVTNVLGQSVAPLSVTIESALRLDDKKAIFQKKPLIGVQGDSRLFAVDFLEGRPARGQYSVSISVSKSDSRFVSNFAQLIKVVVLTEVSVENSEIAVLFGDTGGTAKQHQLEFPKTLSEVLDADSQQRIVFRFALKDAKSPQREPMSAHQTFVRFANSRSAQEVVFVAEMDSELNFKLDLNLHSKAKDFRHLSGEYEISLLIGDPVIQNPIHWSVARVRLHFAGDQSEREAPKDAFGAKPEIRHEFRAHEKRPAPVVSNAFSVLALLPLALLFALWLRLGVNFGRFSLSLSALVFHSSLAAIFLLYGLFFYTLNMFETCKYLTPVAALAFLAGHQLLARLNRVK